MTRLRAWGWSAALWVAAAAPAHAEYDALEKAFYDYGVAIYCSLVDDDVQAGFEHEVAALIARERIDRDGVNTARGNAWTRVEAEWWDRGLGGFRAWCRTEGIAALERFTRAARDLERGGSKP